MDGPVRERNTRFAVDYCLASPNWRLGLQTQKLDAIPKATWKEPRAAHIAAAGDEHALRVPANTPDDALTRVNRRPPARTVMPDVRVVAMSSSRVA